jgi:hypothetical protein
MSMNSQPGRIEHLPARATTLAATTTDERAVLRLSRESLRGDQPAVRFVDKIDLGISQQRLPWRA